MSEHEAALLASHSMLPYTVRRVQYIQLLQAGNVWRYPFPKQCQYYPSFLPPPLMTGVGGVGCRRRASGAPGPEQLHRCPPCLLLISDVKRLLTASLFAGRLATSCYADLLDDAVWCGHRVASNVQGVARSTVSCKFLRNLKASQGKPPCPMVKFDHFL